MRFDRGGRADKRHRFDHVGIKRSLRETGDLPEPPCLLFEDFDKYPADDLSLLLRILDAAQREQKKLTGVGIVKAFTEALAKDGANGIFLVPAQQAIVDKHA